MLIECSDKAMITDLFWTRFSDAAKSEYKAKASEMNASRNLTGRRKMSGFWYFANEMMHELQQPHMRPLYIEIVYTKLSDESKEMFVNHNIVTCMTRYLMYNTILYAEAEFLLL